MNTTTSTPGQPASPGPRMYNNRVLTPITAEVFDAQFPAELPTNFPDRGRGASDTARLELAGESYQLTRVHMPSGEVRRFARQYNGYCEGPTAEDTARSMRFGCAWSPVQVGGGQYRCAGDPSCTGHPRPLPVAEQCRPASTVPAIGSEVELADGHDAGMVGRVLATEGHELGVDMRPGEVLVTWRGGGSQVIRADRLRVMWSPADNRMTVEQQDDAADTDADQYAAECTAEDPPEPAGLGCTCNIDHPAGAAPNPDPDCPAHGDGANQPAAAPAQAALLASFADGPRADFPVHLVRTPRHGWTATTTALISDAQAMGLTFRAAPEQVVLGEFVEVIDQGGTRIGHVASATYHEPWNDPAYVVCTITLR